MNAAHAFRHCSTLLVLVLASVAGARAVELASSSPFLPPGGNADPNATPANSPLELHGILATPDGYKFNLCDPSGHINAWIGLNEAGRHPFVVRAHDVANSRVTVEYQGRELTLSLAPPKFTPMSMQQQAMLMPRPQQMMNVGVPPMQPGAVNVSPDEERRRLEFITDQIKRRRALRDSLQQQQFPPGVNQVQPQQPPQQ